MSNTSRRNHIKQGRMLIVADLYKRGWSIRKIAAEVSSRMNTTCSVSYTHLTLPTTPYV